MSKGNFYITTAISYVNGVPHLGHAYESLLTDVMARFKRLDSYDVFFLTGTDEHGEKVSKSAFEAGVSPQEFADKNSNAFREMTEKLNISNDDFIRTTEDRHYTASQALWKQLAANGDIYLGQYKGWYSVREEAYFTEDELKEDPRTKQKLTPLGTEANWVEEDSYFFKLSAYTDKLLAYYEAYKDFIQPESRYNEIVNFVKGGLNDLSVSRRKDRLPWGIPVPEDADHVMYVWLDALTNYITAVGYPDTDQESYKAFWPADYHVIGKDITRFHTIYWPAFLMAAGLDLPKSIFAHGFINVQGQKMSKSIGNVLSPDDLVESYGLDPLRYLLMREVPHGKDGNFSHAHAVTRINADLANGLGNLAQRTLSMIYKNCDGDFPERDNLTPEDKALLQMAQIDLLPAMQEKSEGFQFHRVLEEIWKVVAEANAYIDTQAPWTLKNEDPVRMAVVLSVIAEVIRVLGIAVQPFTPDAASKLLDQLKISADQRQFEHMGPEYALKPGTTIDKPEGVFPRLIEEEAA